MKQAAEWALFALREVGPHGDREDTDSDFGQIYAALKALAAGRIEGVEKKEKKLKETLMKKYATLPCMIDEQW